jgi:hypothetical protein
MGMPRQERSSVVVVIVVVMVGEMNRYPVVNNFFNEFQYAIIHLFAVK